MQDQKTQMLKSVLKFTLLSVAIIFYGFFVLTRYVTSSNDASPISVDYSIAVEKDVRQINQDMLIVNSIIFKSIKSNGLMNSLETINTLMPMLPTVENIHIVDTASQVHIYDHDKSGINLAYDEDWILNANEQGYISAPYVDPISQKDVITISFKTNTNSVECIAYDISISDFMTELESFTGKAFILDYNDGQRRYASDGLIIGNDAYTASSEDQSHGYTLFDSKYRVVYVGDEKAEHIIQILRKVPMYFIALMIILAFNVFILSHYDKMIRQFFKVIDVNTKPSSFEDLKAIKQSYLHIKQLQEDLEHEKNVLEKIKTSEIAQFKQRIESQKIKKGQLFERQSEIDLLEQHIKLIANASPSLIWISDADNTVNFLNNNLKQALPFESDTITLSQMMIDYEPKSRLLKNKNFNKIKLRISGVQNGEPLVGKTQRFIYGNTLQAIFFSTNTSNYDSKMHHNYLRKSRDLHFINEITKIINTNSNIEQTLQEVIDKVAFLGNFNLCTIRMAGDENTLDCVASSGYSHEFLYEDALSYEDKHIGMAFKQNKMLVINTMSDITYPEDVIYKILSTGRSLVYLPLSNFDKSFGIMTIISDLPFNNDILVMLESIAINVTISLEKLVLYDQLKSNYFKTVEAFVNATEIKSDRFSGHSRRVAEICSAIADRLYLSKSESEEIFISGLLHDVGKLAFQDDSQEYFSDIEAHGEMGMKMIENVGLSKEILDGIAHHHMHYDMRGSQNHGFYEQPYYAQIIRIANDFDVFVFKNQYNFEFKRFFEENADKRGTDYSPQIFNVLKEIVFNQGDKISRIYQA